MRGSAAAGRASGARRVGGAVGAPIAVDLVELGAGDAEARARDGGGVRGAVRELYGVDDRRPRRRELGERLHLGRERRVEVGVHVVLEEDRVDRRSPLRRVGAAELLGEPLGLGGGRLRQLGARAERRARLRVERLHERRAAPRHARVRVERDVQPSPRRLGRARPEPLVHVVPPRDAAALDIVVPVAAHEQRREIRRRVPVERLAAAVAVELGGVGERRRRERPPRRDAEGGGRRRAAVGRGGRERGLRGDVVLGGDAELRGAEHLREVQNAHARLLYRAKAAIWQLRSAT